MLHSRFDVTWAKAFGLEVRLKRIRAGETQDEAAARAGISQLRWSKLERGIAPVTPDELSALCAAYPGLVDVLPPLTVRKPLVLGVPVYPNKKPETEEEPA